MPITKQFIERINAKIDAVPCPTEEELKDLHSLIKTNPTKFNKGVRDGLIIDLSDRLGVTNTFAFKDVVKSRGGYFGGLLRHWYIRASELNELMDEIAEIGASDDLGRHEQI